MSEILDQRDAIAQAKRQGATIIRGDAHTLLLDLDTEEDYEFFKSIFYEAYTHFGLVVKEEWISKSGLGRHVVIHSDKPLNLRTRLLLQACLGSDRMKEMLCLARLKRLGETQPVLLFKPPASKKHKKAAAVSVSKKAKYEYLDDDVPF